MKKSTVAVTSSFFALVVAGILLAKTPEANAASGSDVDLRISVTQYNSFGEHYDMLFQNYDERPVIIR